MRIRDTQTSLLLKAWGLAIDSKITLAMGISIPALKAQ